MTLVFKQGVLAGIDLVAPRTHAEHDLTEVWQMLRRDEPVAWHPAGDSGFWVVSRYRDVTAVYSDGDAFASSRGNVLATLLAGGDSAGGRMLAVTNGPRHREIRRALQRALTPDALEELAERIIRNTRRLVERALSLGECDFAADVARHIPLAAICDLLRVPESDREALYIHTSAALCADSPDATDLEARLARNEILLYFARLRRRSDERPEGIMGILQQLTREPLALSDAELLLNCYSLLLGGDETTRLSLIGIVKALADWPDAWRRLKRGDVAIDTAVDEMLRWTTPALHAGRTSTIDQSLAGRQIAAGQIVTVWNSSANFDPAEFERPHILDLARKPNRHVSFARGPHFCLGAHLARIELGALLRVLAETTDEIEIIGQPARIYSNFLSGYSSLRVRLTPAARARRSGSSPDRERDTHE
jgi:cytochrome P450